MLVHGTRSNNVIHLIEEVQSVIHEEIQSVIHECDEKVESVIHE